MVVPVNAPVKLTAVTAENHLCKTVIAGETALLACRADVDYPATDKLRLHLHEELFRYNGLMVILHIVLRHRAIVLDPFLGKEVGGIGLLQQGVSDVLFISKNLVDRARVPFFFPGTGENAVSFQTGGGLGPGVGDAAVAKLKDNSSLCSWQESSPG